MQEAVLAFMTSSMHEHFTGNTVGNRPMKVADGYFTLRVPDMSDSVWAQLAKLIGQDGLLEMEGLAESAGLAVRRLAWPHPRQTWFVGALERDRVDEVAEAVSGPYPSLRPPGG